MVTLEDVFLGLGLTITEIDINEVQKQENKSVRNDAEIACQQVCKQGRDDIKVKVNCLLPL